LFFISNFKIITIICIFNRNENLGKTCLQVLYEKQQKPGLPIKILPEKNQWREHFSAKIRGQTRLK
jgi:hypothetical protein